MNDKTEKFLHTVANGLKYGVVAGARYLVHNGRQILGLFSLLLVGWGGVVMTIPNRKTEGELMIATGSVLKAWLSDSSSKTPADGGTVVMKQQVEVANVAA